MDLDPNHPNLSAELTRKILETMEALETRRNAGAVEAHVVGWAAKLFWMVSSGLIDSDVSEILSSTAAAAIPKVESRFFLAPAGGGAVSFTWMADRDHYLMVLTRADHTQVQKQINPPAGERKKHLEAAFAGLQTRGYLEL